MYMCIADLSICNYGGCLLESTLGHVIHLDAIGMLYTYRYV